MKKIIAALFVLLLGIACAAHAAENKQFQIRPVADSRFSWSDRMCVLPGDSSTSREFAGGHRSSGARQVSPPRWPDCGCQNHESKLTTIT